eukprot:SAG31_NODE_18_length_35375_cov_22.525315_4_plen_76_part_00
MLLLNIRSDYRNYYNLVLAPAGRLGSRILNTSSTVNPREIETKVLEYSCTGFRAGCGVRPGGEEEEVGVEVARAR